MDCLIHVNATKSTLSSPIGFFDSFFKMNLVVEAKNCFLSRFPNPDDEDDYWNAFPVNVDHVNERFTIQYLIENYIDGYEIQQDWVEIEYSLEGELHKLFKNEYEKSKLLLLDKFDIFNENTTVDYKVGNRKNLKEALNDIRMNILKYLDEVSSASYTASLSKTMKAPLNWLMLFLYNRFSSELPTVEGDPRILEIIKSVDSIKEKLDLKVLKPNTAYVFDQLRDRMGMKIIEFSNPTEDLENFSLFCNGKIDEINHPINFISNFGAVNYLIGKITKKLSLSRSKIEEMKIIKMGKGIFIAKLCNTDFSRYPIKNKEWADLIDKTFSGCNM